MAAAEATLRQIMAFPMVGNGLGHLIRPSLTSRVGARFTLAVPSLRYGIRPHGVQLSDGVLRCGRTAGHSSRRFPTLDVRERMVVIRHPAAEKIFKTEKNRV